VSVYFIRDERNRVKIGVTRDKTATARLANMQTGNADCLTVVRFIAGAGHAAEWWFHNHYTDRRITGEWFCWCETMLTLSLPSNFVDTPLRKRIYRAQILRSERNQRYHAKRKQKQRMELEGAP
jgi:epoxyqueuosine reductase QueG